MNKKVLFSLTALAVAALTSFTAYKSFTPQLSEADILLNENIEALTNGEETSQMTCYNTITSKDGSMVRYCQTCTYIPGTESWFSLADTCSK